MSHLGPWFERPQKHAVPNCLRISLPPMSPPPSELDYSNCLGRVPLLSRIPALVLEHGLVWLDVVPIQCEIGAIFTHRWCDFWNGSRCG